MVLLQFPDQAAHRLGIGGKVVGDSRRGFVQQFQVAGIAPDAEESIYGTFGEAVVGDAPGVKHVASFGDRALPHPHGEDGFPGTFGRSDQGSGTGFGIGFVLGRQDEQDPVYPIVLQTSFQGACVALGGRIGLQVEGIARGDGLWQQGVCFGG